MICKTCGTEIADKALICYRCGNSTFEPTRRERPGRRRRSGSLLTSLVALIVLVTAALLMGRAAVGAVPQTISIVLVVLAAIVFALQVFRRRR